MPNNRWWPDHMHKTDFCLWLWPSWLIICRPSIMVQFDWNYLACPIDSQNIIMTSCHTHPCAIVISRLPGQLLENDIIYAHISERYTLQFDIVLCLQLWINQHVETYHFVLALWNGILPKGFNANTHTIDDCGATPISFTQVILHSHHLWCLPCREQFLHWIKRMHQWFFWSWHILENK